MAVQGPLTHSFRRSSGFPLVHSKNLSRIRRMKQIMLSCRLEGLCCWIIKDVWCGTELTHHINFGLLLRSDTVISFHLYQRLLFLDSASVEKHIYGYVIISEQHLLHYSRVRRILSDSKVITPDRKWLGMTTCYVSVSKSVCVLSIFCLLSLRVILYNPVSTDRSWNFCPRHSVVQRSQQYSQCHLSSILWLTLSIVNQSRTI